MANARYYAVRDKKAEAFMNPFQARTDGEAIRSFMNAIEDKESPFHKYPGDFDLFWLGRWDDATGLFEPASVDGVVGVVQVITGLQVGGVGQVLTPYRVNTAAVQE